LCAAAIVSDRRLAAAVAIRHEPPTKAGSAMAKMIRQLLAERGLSDEQFADQASLEKRVAQRLIAGQWTPSPDQRTRIAKVLGVDVAEIRWGHSTAVDHMYGHGPQFGRSP
jgi:ribosome-binding protein aMBF1 (putative translation factor)